MKRRSKEEAVRFFVDTDVLGLEKAIAPISYIPPTYNLIDYQNVESYELASLLRRAVALAVDVAVMIIVFILATLLFESIGQVSPWARAAVFVFMWYLYDPVLTAYACTAGQYFANIRVRQYSAPNESISLLKAFLRFSIKSPLGWVTFITLPFSEGKRAVHDLVSGSVVLKLNNK